MSRKKGVSLPVNMLVILAVSIIVLLALVAFFMTSFNPKPITAQNVQAACCAKYVRQDKCGSGGWGGLSVDIRGRTGINCQSESGISGSDVDEVCCAGITG